MAATELFDTLEEAQREVIARGADQADVWETVDGFAVLELGEGIDLSEADLFEAAEIVATYTREDLEELEQELDYQASN
jgi:hypothetical protein